jgi:hypothetical protein
MSTLSIVSQIEASIAAFLPTTLAAVLAVEATAHSTPGQSKLQTVLNVVMATTGVAEQVPVPSVAAVAGLANLLVTILNATGVFNHGATPPVIPVAATPAA